MVRDSYGPPDVLRLEEIPKPEIAEDELLVRVRASSINAADNYTLRGPYIARFGNGLRRPKTRALGVDFAGTVEAVGASVTRFKPGDEVFGGRNGAYGEYVAVREERAVAHKPAHVGFDEAAAVPIAGITALQAVRDKGQVQEGQRVLVNGGSGGVGTYTVQLAKAFGAHVTAVCHTDKVELVQSLGADRVVDYTREDFTRSGERYDVVLDVAGSRSWSECLRVLEPDSTVVIIGAPKGRPLRHIGGMWLGSKRSRRKGVFFIAKLNGPDLTALGELLEAGTVKSSVERRYELSDLPDAFRYFGEGHARGKIVITV
jgi:NADPH:quinone reductase-like Zn-dependent oxidoreductase